MLVTVPGRGYRFVAEVVEVEDPAGRAANRPGPALSCGPDRTSRGLLESGLLPAVARATSALQRAAWMAASAAAVAIAALASGARLPIPNLVADCAATASDGGQRRAAGTPATHLRIRRPRHPTWSPDGRRVAFTSDRAGQSGHLGARSPATRTPFA